MSQFVLTWNKLLDEVKPNERSDYIFICRIRLLMEQFEDELQTMSEHPLGTFIVDNPVENVLTGWYY